MVTSKVGMVHASLAVLIRVWGWADCSGSIRITVTCDEARHRHQKLS